MWLWVLILSFALRGNAPLESGVEEQLQACLARSLVEAGQAGARFHQENRNEWLPHLILSRWNIKKIAGLAEVPEALEGVHPVLVQTLAGHAGVVFSESGGRDAALLALAAREPAGTAAVLGMGRGFDIPLAELALRYRKVVLVDLDEPNLWAAIEDLRRELDRLGLPAEKLASVLGRVEIQLADLSGIGDRLGRFVVPHSRPEAVREGLLFLDRQASDPQLRSWPLRVAGTYDLVVSSFVVSQISSEIVRSVEDLIAGKFGPLTQGEWAQFQQALQRLSKAAAENHAGHIAALLAPGGKAYFSSESTLLWPDQNVQAPLFPINDLLETARGTHHLSVTPAGQWLWMQRMNGIFYPGAGYWVEAYQISRGGLEEMIGVGRESALFLDSGA